MVATVFELASSPHRIGWGVAVGWFLVLVFVSQAARYVRWREAEEHAGPATPSRPTRRRDLPGGLALATAAAVPGAVAPMMMLRPPGDISMWLGAGSLVWAGAWIAIAMVQAIQAEVEIIDLTETNVIDLRGDALIDSRRGPVDLRS